MADASAEDADGTTATPGGRKLTEHALESLPRHGFHPPFTDVDEVIDQATRTATQDNGAAVYIRKTGRRGLKYNVVIVGADGVVTGLKDLTRHELNNLGRNYGFDPQP